MNTNNPNSPPPAPRPGPICPNCLRGGGKHFPACPLDSPRRLALEGSALVERDRATGKEVARHEIPGGEATMHRLEAGRVHVERVGKHALPQPKPPVKCHTCNDKGTITEGGMFGGELTEEPCPDCKGGSRG